MPRHSFGALATGAGSTTLPMMSLYAAAASGACIREVSIFNTTAVAVDISVRRLTTAGTQGAAIDELAWNENRTAPQCTAFQAHSGAAPTATAGFVRRIQLGAAVGGGVIWTFGEDGLVIPEGTANGIGIIPAAGTGQLCIVELVWDE